MNFLALSLNHRVTPLEVREGVVFRREDGEEFLRRLKERSSVEEAMLVSTCNRTEVYSVYEPDETLERDVAILELLSEIRGFVPRQNPRNYAVLRDEEAVRHLFRVASGLDSQILGESQILGQVKSSLDWAREAGTSGRVIHRLWERALRVGKRVRTETAIGEGALTVSYAALELAGKIFGSLEGREVLLIGTGEVGVLALENLKGVELGGLTVMNRTRRHAEELAERFGGDVRDLEELPGALGRADLVISSTASPGPLVRYEDMKQIRHLRTGDRPLLIVDLAVPRDFEEACGGLDEVFLKNLDDLTEIVRSNAADRRTALPSAETIIENECATFFNWIDTLEVEPTIRKLRERFHAIRKAELEAWRSSLDEESFARLDRLTRRLVNRLLHVPSENLRRHDRLRDRAFVAAVHELLTQEIPHPKQREAPEGGESPADE